MAKECSTECCCSCIVWYGRHDTTVPYIVYKLLNFPPVRWYPSCTQATPASTALQKSSQTVPQAWLSHTSTRPSRAVLPPTSRMSPLLHTTVVLQIYFIYSFILIQHTLANNSSIFRVATVVDSYTSVGTAKERSFTSSTAQVIQENVPSSPTKCSTASSNCTCVIKSNQIRTQRVFF